MTDRVKHEVTVSNRQGLHARPAYMFAQLAGKFDADVYLAKDGERVDGKSILSILTLGAVHGSLLSIEAAGNDASAAVAELAELVESGFPVPVDNSKDPQTVPETPGARSAEETQSG